MTSPPPRAPELPPEPAASDWDRLLRAHEEARLDLILRHEAELETLRASHATAQAALRQQLEAAQRAYRATLPELVALSRRVLELEAALDAVRPHADVDGAVDPCK